MFSIHVFVFLKLENIRVPIPNQVNALQRYSYSRVEFIMGYKYYLNALAPFIYLYTSLIYSNLSLYVLVSKIQLILKRLSQLQEIDNILISSTIVDN